MKQFFQNMKMRTKIIVIVLVVSVLTTSAGLYFGYLFNMQFYKNNIVESLVEDVHLISDYMVMPMEFDAPEKGREVLEKLQSKSRILNCQVFSSDNTLFTSIDFGNELVAEIPQELKEKGVILGAKYIEVYKSITYQQGYYGAIYIRAESSMQYIQQRYFIIAVILAVVMAVLAFLMAHLGQKPIVKPIESLNETMERVSENKDYSLRLKVAGKDEVASLNEAFNRMLDTIQLNEQERDRALEALKANQEELITAKEKAEESDRLKTVFLQNMSHEIRTPMNAIIGFSDLLNMTSLTDDQKTSYLKIIQNSSQQLLSIVTDILTISAIETKQATVSLEKVGINAILDEMWTVFNKSDKKENVELEIEKTLTDQDAYIYSDKTKLTQVLTNLISNALKFTEKGSVRFGYKKRIRNGIPVLEFFVRDTGIGIDEQRQNLIFERFVQADDSIQRNFGGTGLGLSICKGFVEMLDGEIWLESELQKGSVFYFTIPYKPADVDNLIVKKNKDVSSNSAVVLVAEDEEYNFLYIEELLQNLGVKLLRAKNGQESIEMFKSNPNIGLILMDIKMPVMSGYQAAKIIKQMKADMPIVAQSAYALEEEVQRYSKVFDDYITKPISSGTLTQKVSKYLSVG